RLELARDQVEVGGLAGPVRSDDGRQRTPLERAADSVDGDVAAEADGQVARLECGVRHHCEPPPVIPEAEPQARLYGTSSNESNLASRGPGSERCSPAARIAPSGMTGWWTSLLVQDRDLHVLDAELAHQLGDAPLDVGIDLDPEVVHRLQRLVV